MSEDNTSCLICGDHHTNAEGQAKGCPTMLTIQATDARRTNVPPQVYSGYLNAREAMRGNSHQKAAKGLRLVLSSMAEDQGAQPDASFSDKIAKLCDKDVIGARMRNGLLKQAMSENVGEAQAWALMSIAEHAFYRLYLGKGRGA